MHNKQFSQSQIEAILSQLEQGTAVDVLCAQYDISTNTLFRWKVNYGGTDTLLDRLAELEEENYKLKGILSNLKIQEKAKQTGDADHIYRILAANIPGTAITILDREERYLLAEGDFLSTMGYVKESMPGKRIADVISPENYKGYYEKIIGRVFGGETILEERHTLSGYFALIKAVPLRDGLGEIFAIMFVLIDVSAIKQASFELAKINGELETKVIERTEQLKEANRQLESFSYSVSHDLRAPLRSISGFAKILKEDYSLKLKDVDFDKTADRVISNAEKMERLINDLLDFSRLERKNLLVTKVDMEKLVQEVLEDLKQEHTARKLEISQDTLISVEGDPALLRQVWINLLSNAFKYSKNQETIRIAITSLAAEDKVTYAVSDNGAGFDMKFADKLFGVFQRLHRSSEFEGTGIGLALVKSIVLRHKGTIWATSELEKGATFYFSLPLVHNQPAA